MTIDSEKLIKAIEERGIDTVKPLSFKWYTKQGYAKWMSAEAVNKERKEILAIIRKLSEE